MEEAERRLQESCLQLQKKAEGEVVERSGEQQGRREEELLMEVSSLINDLHHSRRVSQAYACYGVLVALFVGLASSLVTVGLSNPHLPWAAVRAGLLGLGLVGVGARYVLCYLLDNVAFFKIHMAGRPRGIRLLRRDRAAWW